MIRRTSFSLAAAAFAVAGGLALAQPAQADFRVNTTVAGQQINSDTAVNPTDGSFVTVWQSENGDNGYDIYFQRYDLSGNALGGEVLVNTVNQAGRQSRPSVAVDATGDFVVVWESDNGDESSYGIFGQRYNASGVAQGTNFQVNTTTTGLQTAPDVAMDDAGNFIVVYEDASLGESDYNLRARSYTAAGAAGTEVLINSEAGDQQLPDVALTDAGTQAVVVYRDSAQDGSGYGVAGLRLTPNFGATPTAIGSEFTVNQTTAGDQDEPAVDMDADGDFVVAWQSGAEGARDVYARRYTETATPVSSEFVVGSTSGDQYLTDVAVADGDIDTFVVTYGSDQTESYEIYAQRYDSSGALQGSPIVVNEDTGGSQIAPSIDADNSGNFVITWQGNQTEDYDIYADRFTPAGATVPQGTPFVQTEENACPTANFTTSQSQGQTQGLTLLTIDAGSSTDSDGDTLTYTYEVRDGNNTLVANNTTSSSVQSFELAPGNYNVTVRVSDGDTSCDISEGSDAETQPITVQQLGSTFNSSVNATGYVVPTSSEIGTAATSPNRGKVQLSFWGAFNRNGLGGGLALKDPRFGGYEFKSTNITSIVVNGRTATINGFGKSTSPEGTFSDVAFTASGIDIYASFIARGDQVEVQTDDGYSLQGFYDRGDVKVVGGTTPPPSNTTQRR